MKKYTPLEKRSKKEQKGANSKHRGSWGDVNPVTRKPPDPKVYDWNREKVNKQEEETAHVYYPA